ncbi:glycosyltransferase family 9 protein [Flammeovirga kamogawensis]|uniref:Glycosyltransferase family 9 protein n=1 Tax=Flammeovirga kamogawensis TaxID=373891 RepID=A0ABX8GSJ2_9BACT|nr:glycosyltransferase family 9 protein [Flammeovirga kamogawensis]MBB6463001.1 ADP-heptose:LPS heptosyltransferase [Flammeovirga kamogawensis]QWG06526.1 glycosyltransferase family 9 protein [Flammeovirga kamogawensis]TRX68354.1 glycosyltransferase family 9 protein [Flammeovirga kamogawensis]
MSKKILALRFSAMGDVAMTAPVMKEVLEQNPDTEIIMVSRPFLKPFFDNIPRMTFVGADLNGKHKGFGGLTNLFKELKKLGPFTAVADLHSVLRTFIIDGLFQASGTKVYRIDKGRKGKKALTKPSKKKFEPLRSTPERYADVFRKIGLDVTLSNQLPPKGSPALKNAELELLGGKNQPWVGIAPFAQHKGKIWGETKAVALAKMLQEKLNVKVLFFGGPGKEAEILEECIKEVPNSVNLAGNIKLKEELDIIELLDLMVSMDSANMHMASLRGTECVSIWGATHHYAGFLGYGQSTDNIVEISEAELPCRPCSVFGNKPCLRNDYACLDSITPEMVYHKIANALNK